MARHMLREALGYEASAIAEVGVYEGANARKLRIAFPSAHLYLIDPWVPMPCGRSYEINNRRRKWRRVEALCRQRFYADTNCTLHKLPSHYAVTLFPSQFLDIAFLDAGREYSVLYSLVADWRKKVRPGGLVAGKGLAGHFRGDVRLVLKDHFGSAWFQLNWTTWAARV